MARVLVADDEAPIREMIEIACSMDGHEVRGAETADEAIAVYDAFDPQVVLLDVSMPGGGGERVLEQLRKRGEHCPVIMVSGFAAAMDVEEWTALGASGVLAKPFAIDGLRQAVNDAVGEG